MDLYEALFLMAIPLPLSLFIFWWCVDALNPASDLHRVKTFVGKLIVCLIIVMNLLFLLAWGYMSVMILLSDSSRF